MKFKISPMIISIGFLPTLCSLHPIPDNLNLLNRVLNQIWTQKLGFTCLKPTNRGPTFTSIQSLKWRHLDARLITIIIGKLEQWQMLIPLPCKVQDTSPKHILKGLNGPLRLAISLRVKRHAKQELCAKCILKRLPESQSKLGTSIRNNG